MLFLPLLIQAPAQIRLDLGRPGVAVSPTLYGLMTEEINYSYDGGLYGELVRNRAFLDDRQRPSHWTAIGDGASVELDRSGPTRARPIALKVKGGVANDGYWGIPVRPSTTYHLSLLVKSDSSRPLIASIESPDAAKVYAHSSIKGIGDGWREVEVSLRTGKDVPVTKDARLALRLNSGQTAWFSQVSLFPPTFRNRKNGNRPDLMQKLVDMKPQFLRFPGGNYLEGGSLSDYFPWKMTLGPIVDRPGHRGPWGYRSTDGMGLLEFLLWTEEMKAKPVLAVFAGYALNGQVVKAGPGLNRYVQEALDEIEYVIGGPDTRWGAQRVADGHPKPFPLECVEVGNEDGFDKSGSYDGRFAQFYDAIKAKYPRLRIIATIGGKDWLGQRSPLTLRKPDLYDEHYYADTWTMMSMATKYDSYERKGPKIFVGEWATQGEPGDRTPGRLKGPTPKMGFAIADAAFMTGLERNSDIVEMACYAPLLVNANPGGRQWAINMIGYDALTSFGSPSYYAQTMFSRNLGDRTVHVQLVNVPNQTQGDRSLPGLFVSATRDTKRHVIYLKVVNALPAAQEVSIDLAGGSVAPEGTAIVLSGDPQGINSLENPTNIVPVTTTADGLGSSFRRAFPAHSITVLTMRERR